MARFLLKTEPSDFAFVDLVRDGRVTWDGVRNPLALRHLRSIRKGDDVLVYHTGTQRSVVGLARASSDARPDPKDSSGKAAVVDLVPVAGAKTPVTLAAIRADKRCANLALIRMSRLSVMPVPAPAWKAITTAAGLSARR
jgi:predicted RNA-binding protein with PUA-like domain